ncbi:leucine-rich repeat and IQ domain-containing protein 1 [Erinaceus europaeus]|uniref:Leucine-rich repeat and IQ domain-containing protein 1 n=1 Tax=Erinaceus europaeus TaxID=9365 RepID=A0ABM3XL21_ERIEU|nr:leucine-rich repeat and IQ domain-containing protein 1 [Erinaceus europaeus]
MVEQDDGLVGERCTFVVTKIPINQHFVDTVIREVGEGSELLFVYYKLQGYVNGETFTDAQMGSGGPPVNSKGIMEDDDDDVKLNEEIEAELDKISISSLEKDIDSDSISEIHSNDSNSDFDELPESVLHCINAIKNKSKSVEELILQDIEDADGLSYNYGTASNDHMCLRIDLSTKNKENPELLMKMLAEIEKEEFLRSETHCYSHDSVPEPGPHDLSVDEDALPDDTDINFGYYEVEERCRQSFEAWQDKQKELEEQEKESLKAQRDREEKQFQEEEDKRYCWMKQFEIEKKKLENMQKKEQDKMNDELHKEEKMWEEKFKEHEEFIRKLHLQMEEERTRFKDLQEKEKMHLLKLRHKAAVKIQAKYKAFILHKKYGPIIKEQVERKERKALEWKEKEAKIRQIEGEKQKRLEEQQRVEEERKKKRQEERKRREREYEEKKNILREEKERLKFREDVSKQPAPSRTFKQGECNAKHLTAEDTAKKKDHIATKLGDEKSRKWEHVPLWLTEASKKRENICRQLILKESIQVKPRDYLSNQATLANWKMDEKNENLVEQEAETLADQATAQENTDKESELEKANLKENMTEWFQLQDPESKMKEEETMETALRNNVKQETQGIAMLGYSQEINTMKSSEGQEVLKDRQQTKIQNTEKEEASEQNEMSHEENIPVIATKQNLLPPKLEKCDNMEENTVVEEKEIDLTPEETQENSKDSVQNDDVISNITDARINLGREINNQGCILGRDALCEDVSCSNVKKSLVFSEVKSLISENKEIPEECCEDTVGCVSIVTPTLPKSTLLSCIEEKRLAWIKSLKPWFEIFKQSQQRTIVKRKRAVKCPVNRMPPLNTLEILQCGPWNTLQQVTTITFQDLPGCNLSTLTECMNLQFLSLRHCGLTDLCSLSSCKKLKYIDAQENHIEAINCENLENLCVVLLNKNQLTSFHGLDGCSNIQNLEVSHNKITRIGGLESLKNLQQLVVDHNQLISTKGLCDTPTIIYLDCSYNNLTEVEGIESCGLLQILKLQGNYLSELPSLENHVLLRELHLDDNSISTVGAFSSCWLPLLQNLTLSQNSLTKIIPLFHFISLEKLDVSNNCLSDLTSAMRWFDACYSLRELFLTGNPLLQEINWRSSLLKLLPALRILDDEILNSHSESYTDDCYHPELEYFMVLCQSQIRKFNLLLENYITGNGNTFTLDAAENLCLYFKKLMALSKECRQAHEFGDVSLDKRDESESRQNHLASTSSDGSLQTRELHSCTTEYNPCSPAISENWRDSDSPDSPLINSSSCETNKGGNQENIEQKTEESSKTNSIPTKCFPCTETVMPRSLLRNYQSIEHREKIKAAVVIQEHWRNYTECKQICFSAKPHTAPTELTSWPNSYIKNQAILKEEEREHVVTLQEQRENAAILIQAVWKGFVLRKKLAAALEAIKNVESEEEYEDIDLEDFTFDEAALEKEWLASDSTRFPSQTLPLPNQLHWPKFPGTLKCDDTSLNLPSHPTQAWLCNEKENLFSSEQTYSRSESSTLSWVPESKTSRKNVLISEKEGKISEEWGFKDVSTAQQMLKRAQKMKSKKLRKNLDPTMRLALFKSNENKVSVAKSPKKTQSRRDGYFEVTPWNLDLGLNLETPADSLASRMGKEEDFIYKDITENEKLEKSKEYTYRWLHTQVRVHEATSSRNMKGNHFLPELDPEVRNGGRVQLVARLVSREDTDLDLFSMTSGSALSVKREKKSQAHRHSAGSSSFSVKGILAPMISNTRPSKKERISFRDNPVQLSGGWGSGKKKVKTSK